MGVYNLIEYDVWGNPKDGFEVNAAYDSGLTVCLDGDETDHEIIGLLKGYYLKKTVKNSKFSIDGDYDFSLYITHEPTGEPVCELRKRLP